MNKPAPSPQPLLQIYRTMLRIRLVEETVAALYSEQEMRCPVHLCTGQEAVAAGVSAHLRPEDYVLSNHRSHGHYLAKGGDLNAMICEFYGKATGCSSGKGGSMHLVDTACGFLGSVSIVASAIPIAVGAAFGASLRGEDRLAAVYFGDAATEEGVFHESLNFAALNRLPILFVCENNAFSVYTHFGERRPPGQSLAALAASHGLTVLTGDGNDAADVYRLAGEAITRIRAGGGPCFLEFATYRWREHCGPNFDDHLGYRDPEEARHWRECRCPLARFGERLKSEGQLTNDMEKKWQAEITAEIAAAVAKAKADPFPDANQLLAHVYA
jgi:pyruvate dehydrogenase E1 component alpha subunit